MAHKTERMNQLQAKNKGGQGLLCSDLDLPACVVVGGVLVILRQFCLGKPVRNYVLKVHLGPGAGLGAGLGGGLGVGPWGRLDGGRGGRLGGRLDGGLGSRLCGSGLGGRSGSSLGGSRLGGRSGSRLGGRLDGRLRGRLRGRLWAGLKGGLGSRLKGGPGAGLGGWLGGWLRNLDWGRFALGRAVVTDGSGPLGPAPEHVGETCEESNLETFGC